MSRVVHVLQWSPRHERIFNLGTRWRWGDGFMSRPPYLRYPLNRRIRGTQGLSWHFKDENLYPQLRMEPQLLGLPSHTLVTTTTELCRILSPTNSSHNWSLRWRFTNQNCTHLSRCLFSSVQLIYPLSINFWTTQPSSWNELWELQYWRTSKLQLPAMSNN